ncbi:sulfotransferase family protein [Rhodobacteraceae bacterium M382]|nr:sulfotransferase family protein [Rhodobacteraceae bacterium M382]
MVISVEKFGVVYAAVPKAGCSSVKAMLADLVPEAVSDQDGEDREAAHHAAFQTRRWRGDKLLALPDAFRFTVVRDPVKRLMSVYTDRVVGRNDLYNSRRLRRQSELPLDPDPDVFFGNIQRYASLSSVIKHHVFPTYMFTGVDLSLYDKVYRTNEMAQVALDLSAHTGVSLSSKHANKSKAKLDFNDLKPETQDQVRAFLAEDYDLLSDYFDNPFA